MTNMQTKISIWIKEQDWKYFPVLNQEWLVQEGIVWTIWNQIKIILINDQDNVDRLNAYLFNIDPKLRQIAQNTLKKLYSSWI